MGPVSRILAANMARLLTFQRAFSYQARLAYLPHPPVIVYFNADKRSVKRYFFIFFKFFSARVFTADSAVCSGKRRGRGRVLSF